MSDNIIFHNECSCLLADSVYSDRCLKRYYNVFDPEEISYKKQRKVIAICNDLLRIKARDILYSKGPDSFRHYEGSLNFMIGRMAIEEIILQHICKKSREDDMILHKRGTIQNDLFDKQISFIICEKPWISRSYDFTYSVEMAMSGSLHFTKEILNTIKFYLDHNSFKKYKTKYSFCNKLLKDIRWSYGEERNQLIIELFNQILQLKIKNK